VQQRDGKIITAKVMTDHYHEQARETQIFTVNKRINSLYSVTVVSNKPLLCKSS